ncbi:MAG: hypothetical protein KAH54_04125 [Candidatus Sabulitectum sp.]|nr:hypothetical protein [Candidatus Sabulitectum sp.]
MAGFFTGIADVVQYLRYSSGFPENNYTINLLAGIAALLMFSSSLSAVIKLYKKRSKKLSVHLAVSSAMAFVLGFMPRTAIGSAVRLDLFIYLGGLGVLALLLVSISAPPDTPDDSP